MSGETGERLRVLFVDQKNDSVSQIAEHFTRQLYGDRYEVYSAGPEHDIVDCDLIIAMYRSGEDIRRHVSKDFKNLELLREDEEYDLVIYLAAATFDEWAARTPWQGRQVLADMGSVRDFEFTDEAELFDAYDKLTARVREWVVGNMGDPDRLRTLVRA
jgi:arsenate reductase